MVKVSNICIGLKNTCLGVLKREERDKDNGPGLKEGGGIEISTTVLHSRAAPSTGLKEGGGIEISITVLHSRAAPSLEYLLRLDQLQRSKRPHNIRLKVDQ